MRVAVKRKAEELREVLLKKGKSLGNFGIVAEDEAGELQMEYLTGRACYAPLNYADNPITTCRFPALAFVDVAYGAQRTTSSGWEFSKTEAAEDYAKYLLSNSVFSKVYVDKDARQVLDKGVICNTNHCSKFTILACEFFRMVLEQPQIVTNWYPLVKAGVHPGAALFAMHCMMYNSDEDSFRVRSCTTGHSAFNSSETHVASMLYLVKKKKGANVKFGEKMKNGCFKYAGKAGMFNPPGTDRYGLKTEWEEPPIPLQRTESTYNSPFAVRAAPPKSNYIPAAKVAEVVHLTMEKYVR